MKRHSFSKGLVLFCLLMCTAITVVVLIRAELTAGVITALVGLWGGELLLLCLKRVLGDRSPTEKKNIIYEEETGI